MERDLFETLVDICREFSLTNECSDTCPIWKVVKGDCFPSNLVDHTEELQAVAATWNSLLGRFRRKYGCCKATKQESD